MEGARSTGPAVGEPLVVERWGRMGYSQALDRQLELCEQRRSGQRPDTLVVVEHPPTVTLGRHAPQADLLLDAARLAERGIEAVRSDRGGRATYHGPGQLVVYPIVDIKALGLGAQSWVALLEDALIAVLTFYGLLGERREGRPGIWVGGSKIAFVGLRISGGISYHGVSLNCDLDVSVFDCIVPCGAAGEPVTSLARECSAAPPIDDAAERLCGAIAQRIEGRAPARN